MTSSLNTQFSRLSIQDKVSTQYSGFRASAFTRNNLTASTIQRYNNVRDRVIVNPLCARVANVEIPNQKPIEISLTYIYGIGRTTAKKILKNTGVENKRTYNLDEMELVKIREEVENYTIEGDLKRKVAMDIQRLKDIGCYRGKRHTMGLPCRGQRTRTNARTRKGKRKTLQLKKK